MTIQVSAKTLRKIALFLSIVAAVGLGLYVLRVFRTQSAQQDHQLRAQSEHQARAGGNNTISSMGPMPGMTMPMPAPSETAPRGPVRYKVSPEAQALLEVETAEVKREPARVNLRMAGMVFEAEPRVAALTSRVDGRLDKVFIDFTGVQVSKDDPMVVIWSPFLIQSQVELFTSVQSRDSEAIIRGAEEKLMQYGLTKEQVQRIRESGQYDLYITLRAPIKGTVTQKSAVVGQFVKQGDPMYIINDLSRVWVKLDAYEQNMPWIRYGQDVTFTTPSQPGKEFNGKVLFVDPVLDMDSRTVKIRVDAANPDLKLKPHMFVHAILKSEVDSEGRVIKPDRLDAYICPLHPEETSNRPGKCAESGVPLRPASEYGYAEEKKPLFPLVIPETAVLLTGKRSIVYVEVPDQEQPTYELREVILGPRAGYKYVVYHGLQGGERVVTKGNFQIDSSLQIEGRPSMMNPAAPSEGVPHTDPSSVPHMGRRGSDVGSKQ